MIDFIKTSLTDALCKGVRGYQNFSYQIKRSNGDIISLNGTLIKKGRQYLSNFKIERTKENGHKCSVVSVFDMPLNQKNNY